MHENLTNQLIEVINIRQSPQWTRTTWVSGLSQFFSVKNSRFSADDLVFFWENRSNWSILRLNRSFSALGKVLNSQWCNPEEALNYVAEANNTTGREEVNRI